MKFTRPCIALCTAIFLFSGLPLFAQKTTDQYIADLQSEESAVQIESCRKLGEKKEEKAVGELVKLAQSSKDRGVVFQAVTALGQIGKAGVSTDALLDIGRKSAMSEVQYAALLGLVNLRDEKKAGDISSLCQWIQENSTDDVLKDLAVKVAQIIKK